MLTVIAWVLFAQDFIHSKLLRVDVVNSLQSSFLVLSPDKNIFKHYSLFTMLLQELQLPNPLENEQKLLTEQVVESVHAFEDVI